MTPKEQADELDNLARTYANQEEMAFITFVATASIAMGIAFILQRAISVGTVLVIIGSAIILFVVLPFLNLIPKVRAARPIASTNTELRMK